MGHSTEISIRVNTDQDLFKRYGCIEIYVYYKVLPDMRFNQITRSNNIYKVAEYVLILHSAEQHGCNFTAWQLTATSKDVT